MQFLSGRRYLINPIVMGEQVLGHTAGRARSWLAQCSSGPYQSRARHRCRTTAENGRDQKKPQHFQPIVKNNALNKQGGLPAFLAAADIGKDQIKCFQLLQWKDISRALASTACPWRGAERGWYLGLCLAAAHLEQRCRDLRASGCL